MIELPPTTGISCIENVRNQIATQVDTIQKSAGYRSDVKLVTYLVKDVKTMTNFPGVSVLIGNESTYAEDAALSSWRSISTMKLLGYCRQEDADALIHDLLRIITPMCVTKIVDSNVRWTIPVTEDGVDRIKIYRFEFATEKVGWIGIEFPVILIDQEKDFLPPI